MFSEVLNRTSDLDYMVEKEAFTEVSYSLLIFALGFVAFGISKLLALETLISYWMAGVLVFLSVMTCVAGLVHYWRYGQFK